MKQVIIIAEAGVNHNGSLEIGKQLIEAAKEAGADFVKFQTWITDDLVDTSAAKAAYQIENDGSESSQYEMLKRLELSFEEFTQLNYYAEKKGIRFLSTPDDNRSLDFLSDTLNMPLLKVGSGEVNNIPFLRRIGAKKKHVILSTGMSDLQEVFLAYNTLLIAGAKSVALLHCTSSYPAPYYTINLRALSDLKKHFACEVGYSDHSLGNEVALAAVALGASIIEKHFTLDKNAKGPDHKASLEPSELKKLVHQIRNVEQALAGSGNKECQPAEMETKLIVRKGIYMDKDIPKGTQISDEMLIMKRPLNGLGAESYDSIVGKKTVRDIKKGEPLRETDYE